MSVDATTVDASGFEPVYLDDRKVGYVTSGGYGHRTQQSLALAYIDVADLSTEADYEIPLVGDRRPARILPEVAFDPSGATIAAHNSVKHQREKNAFIDGQKLLD